MGYKTKHIPKYSVVKSIAIVYLLWLSSVLYVKDPKDTISTLSYCETDWDNYKVKQHKEVEKRSPEDIVRGWVEERGENGGKCIKGEVFTSKLRAGRTEKCPLGWVTRRPYWGFCTGWALKPSFYAPWAKQGMWTEWGLYKSSESLGIFWILMKCYFSHFKYLKEHSESTSCLLLSLHQC